MSQQALSSVQQLRRENQPLTHRYFSSIAEKNSREKVSKDSLTQIALSLETQSSFSASIKIISLIPV